MTDKEIENEMNTYSCPVCGKVHKVEIVDGWLSYDPKELQEGCYEWLVKVFDGLRNRIEF